MWNVSCSRVFIGQRGRERDNPSGHILLCVCVGGRGLRDYSEKEKKKRLRKEPLGAPCPALAWILHTPCRNQSVISFTPHSFSSLLVKHMQTQAHPSTHTHTDLLMSRLTYRILWFSKKRKNIYSVIFQKDALCCLDATSFFHLYSPIEVESQYSPVLWLLAAC